MKKYIIIFKNNNGKEILDKLNATDIEIHMNVIAIANLDIDSVKELENSKYVESIEPDTTEHLDAELEPDNRHESSTTTYAFDLMNIKEFHKEGITGKGMKVAVLDTGIQIHENLKVVDGINTYDNTKPWDRALTSSHGTQVAGIINAQGLNNNVLGIAPDAEMYGVRIDDGSGSLNRTYWSSQIAGISWALDKGVDAINCSFSSRIDSKARKKAFEIASDMGVAIFCSAGNTQPSGDTTTNNAVYPAKYPFTISSANIDSNKERYTSSCIGQGINFSNGGTRAYSTYTDKNNSEISNKHVYGTGTSYASPATLGIYLLYKQKYKESKEKILQRMLVNAEPLGNSFWYGAGLPKYPTIDYINVRIRG